ncbi:MAG: hypothetical protein FWH21_00625 [Kiritimatiellaeota bacterium]|nr:hypothetical protein [Kiritimatiellota bacterium]
MISPIRLIMALVFLAPFLSEKLEDLELKYPIVTVVAWVVLVILGFAGLIGLVAFLSFLLK